MRELRLQTADGLGLYGWIRPAAGDARALIAHVHGMGEHSHRYDHLTAYWAEHGVASAGFDLRGHGRSEGQRGHTPSYDALMDDIALFLERVTATLPGLPVTLYGHSMGGNLVLNYAIRRRPTLASVVASAPYLRLAFTPPAWRLRTAEWLRHALPALSQRTGLDARRLAHDEAVIQRYLADPLVHDRITLSFFAHVHGAGESIIARAAELTMPTLLMHGMADRITSAAASDAFVAASGGRAVLKRWDGAFHEIHNEPEWPELAAYVLEWIESVGGLGPRHVGAETTSRPLP